MPPLADIFISDQTHPASDLIQLLNAGANNTGIHLTEGSVDPLFCKLIPQRHSSDCLIACLTMLLGTSYEATLVAISKVRPDSGTEGLFWSDARKAAKLLGAKVKVLRGKVDYTNVVGILDCHPEDPLKRHHAVFLLRGVIVDPEESTVWDDWEVYMEANGYVGGSVLVKV